MTSLLCCRNDSRIQKISKIKKNVIQVILEDFAKVSDHIDPNILMKKIEDIDIPAHPFSDS